MTKRRVMRFLNGNNFNIKKTYVNINNHCEWRKEFHPIILTDDMMKLLQFGYCFIHGRDRNFRPILVVNAKILKRDDVNVEDAFNVSWFVCFYMIENLLKREKVENWIDILNLGNLPIAKIPVNALKKFFKDAQEHLK